MPATALQLCRIHRVAWFGLMQLRSINRKLLFGYVDPDTEWGEVRCNIVQRP